jgi:adenylate cyclase
MHRPLQWSLFVARSKRKGLGTSLGHRDRRGSALGTASARSRQGRPRRSVDGRRAISVLGRDHATAAVAIGRALKLNPNSANAWMAKGWVECQKNHPWPAIEALERAIQLSPLDPLNYFFGGGLAFAHLLARQYEEAVEWAERCSREQPRFSFALRVKVVACAHLGRVEEARSGVRRLLELFPKFTITSWRANSVFPAEIWAIFEQGLRKAGLPEK